MKTRKEANKLKKFNELLANLETKYRCPILLEKKIIANGTLQITAYADNKYVQHIKQAIIPKFVLDNIPITQDYRQNNPPCAVCGVLGTELHHWMPQHLSPDAYKWPTSYLCRMHHLEWHNTIIRHLGNGGNGE